MVLIEGPMPIQIATIIPKDKPSNPEENACYFDSATNKLWIYNGSAWKSTTLS
jgi:hypothetical protein